MLSFTSNSSHSIANKDAYRKSSIKPPGGLFISSPLRAGGLFERGRGLFNLEKMMVSVLHKDLE